MPTKYTLETLPQPKDKAVNIVTIPPETIAVLRYSGSIGANAVHEAEASLMKIVSDAGLHPTGEPFTWFYDPPWTLPPLRRNEAAVLIQPG
jgi:DNA gyrase inhibitor GyrI